MTAVWIGDDTNTNAGYTGGTVPAAIWRDFMKQALSAYKTKSFDIPESVRVENEKARAAQAAKEAEAKKDDKAAKDNKNAGNKLLDRITGKNAAKPSESDSTKTN